MELPVGPGRSTLFGLIADLVRQVGKHRVELISGLRGEARLPDDLASRAPLWLVRVLPPLLPGSTDWVVWGSPYALGDPAAEQDWCAYFERLATLERRTAPRASRPHASRTSRSWGVSWRRGPRVADRRASASSRLVSCSARRNTLDLLVTDKCISWNGCGRAGPSAGETGHVQEHDEGGIPDDDHEYGRDGVARPSQKRAGLESYRVHSVMKEPPRAVAFLRRLAARAEIELASPEADLRRCVTLLFEGLAGLRAPRAAVMCTVCVVDPVGRRGAASLCTDRPPASARERGG